MKIGVSRSRSRTSSQHFHAGLVRHHQVEQDQIVGAGLQLAAGPRWRWRPDRPRSLPGSAALPGFRGYPASSSMTRTLPLAGTAADCGIVHCQAAFTGFLARPGTASGNSSMEAGAAAGPADNFDRAAMLLNDTVVTERPRPVPFLRALGGEERIVDAVQMLGRDARARYRSPPRARRHLRARCRTSSMPPASMASRAFRNRFRNTCCSLPGLPLIGGERSASRSVFTCTPAFRTDARPATASPGSLC